MHTVKKNLARSRHFPSPIPHMKEIGTQRNSEPKNVNSPYVATIAKRALQVLFIHRTGKTRRYCQRMDALHSAEDAPQEARDHHTAYTIDMKSIFDASCPDHKDSPSTPVSECLEKHRAPETRDYGLHNVSSYL